MYDEQKEQILKAAEDVGIDTKDWRSGEVDDYYDGLVRLTRDKRYEAQWPYLHSVADLEERHVPDCPMTNSNVESRLECVCRAYDPAERTVAEGG